MLIFHFCFMPLCKGKFVCLFLHYILGTQPTAHNEITKTLDLRILTGEEGLKEKRKNQNDTNSSHSGQFMLFVVLFIKTKQQKAQVQYRLCLQISVLNPHYPVLLRAQMKGFRTVFPHV